jgi:hypothetical protein
LFRRDSLFVVDRKDDAQSARFQTERTSCKHDTDILVVDEKKKYTVHAERFISKKKRPFEAGTQRISCFDDV